MRLRTVTVPCAAIALALVAPAAPALAHGDAMDKVVFKEVIEAQTEGGISKNMEFVANSPYEIKPGATRGMAGTDIEFARIAGRDYAFGGTYINGLQIVDITDPTTPIPTSVYDCAVLQGDVQVFQQGDRVLATYTADSALNDFGAASRCAVDNGAVKGQLGTFILDVTDPANPTSISFAEVPEGSHNMTVHPSGDFLYNSNSDLLVRTPIGSRSTTSASPKITIFDISTPETPVKVRDFPLQYVPLSLGSESHDITFSEDGTRAYSAALSQTLILDTTDPANPAQISQILDPTVQVSHGADPITLKRSDGTDRELLLISDEQAGAATGTNCPGGGVHIYDITNEAAPQKMGIWFIGESKPSTATCTAHVFRMHGDQGLFTIAWYDQGVRVVDVQGLADRPVPAVPFVVSGDGSGIKETGRFTFDDHNTWSFKTNAIATDGSFFGFGNDLGRGLDVYKFDGAALGRTVPALVPTDLHPVGDGETAPVGPGKSDGKGNGKGKGKGPSKDEAFGFLPMGSSGPGSTTALLSLAALTALAANVALVRRTRRPEALTA
ncbi:MAG: hypothetical protein M3524_10715 [Actinomycetota bacterium]|nr:hypothetical protein [Actinomycetota bacterium]